MLILALDTTAEVCSVAVRDGQGILVERLFRHRMHLSERLIGDVDAVLHDAGASLASVDALAVGVGPGSFTGVRIGVTTAKTWADTLAKPVCGITALDALAEEYSGVPELVVPVIRSRPGTVYASFYRTENGHPNAIDQPAAFTIQDLAERAATAAAGAACLLCGPGLERHGGELAEALHGRGVRAFLGRPDGPRASLAAAVALRRLGAGQADDPLRLVPLYVVPPPIDPRVEEQVRARERGRTDRSGG